MGMGEVEERIIRADNELAKLTDTHVGLARESAAAEARWKNHRDRIIVRISRSGDKGAKDTREALAKQERCENPYCPCTDDPWAGEKLYTDYEAAVALKKTINRLMDTR